MPYPKSDCLAMLALFSLLFLAGCSCSVTSQEWAMCERLCFGHNAVQKVQTEIKQNWTTCICKDSERFALTDSLVKHLAETR